MKSARPVCIDMLEARRLMAAAALATSVTTYGTGQMLKIAGTAGNDTITLTYNGTAYTLHTAAGFTKILTGAYNAIQIHAGAGNDRVTIDAGITTPTFLFGDAGNDTLTGGSGDDHIYGGLGTNYLYGMAGRDTLVSLGGATNDNLTGGADEDYFWADSNVTEKIFDADAFELAHTVNRVSTFATEGFVTGVRSVAVGKEINAPRLRDPDLNSKTYVYKPFATNTLFAASGPTADDVKQGQVGDCYFLSTMAGTAATNPETIRDMMTDLGDGTYAVRFKSGATTKFYRVDNDLAVFNKTSTSPAYAALGTDGSMWVAVVEKAWTFARRNQGSYNSISSGWMGEVFSALGATNQQSEWKTDVSDPDAYIAWVEQRLAAGDVVTLGIYTSNNSLNLIGGHAYTVTGVTTAPDGTKQIVIRNPWGIDGYRTDDGANDGYVTLTDANALIGIDAFVSGHMAS